MIDLQNISVFSLVLSNMEQSQGPIWPQFSSPNDLKNHEDLKSIILSFWQSGVIIPHWWIFEILNTIIQNVTDQRPGPEQVWQMLFRVWPVPHFSQQDVPEPLWKWGLISLSGNSKISKSFYLFFLSENVLQKHFYLEMAICTSICFSALSAS